MTRSRLLGNSPLAHGWRLLRAEAPALTETVRPGQLLRLTADGVDLTLPVSHASSAEGWLAALAPPDSPAAALALHAPLTLELTGDGWDLAALTAAPVIVGSDSGVGAALFAAERLAQPPRLVILGGAYPPPFRPVPSTYMTPDLPAHVIGAAPALEARGVVSRVASTADLPGCFDGTPAELAALWLAINGTAPVLACAPAAELEALAARLGAQLHGIAAPA